MRKQKMRVIVSGGGTGGHIYPALAIAECLQAELGAEILYMGATTDQQGGPAKERELAENAGYRYLGVQAAPLRRNSPLIVWDVLTNLRGVKQAERKIAKFQPQVVVGTGGYAMAPVLRAAVGLKIPTLLHEQNAFPGWANRYLAKKVSAICLTFEAAAQRFPQGCTFYTTGLPVRAAISHLDREAAYAYWGIAPEDRKRPTLLVTGGSQGAQRLNQALTDSYEPLLAAGLRIIHLTGEQHYAECENAAAKLIKKENLILLPYLKEMQQALALADLVVARAGASFLAEIALVGLPAILVPYPYAANNHQAYNAQAFADAGTAYVLDNEDCRAARLQELILSSLEDQAKLARMKEAMLQLGRGQAAQEIVQVIKRIVNNGGE